MTLKRYAIWDKISPIFTPSGAAFTAEEWIEKYPISAFDTITVVCSAGEINGGFWGTLGQMKQMKEAEGCDFSDCTTNVEILTRIEEWEDSINQAAQEASMLAAQTAELNAMSTASIAASLEYQNMMTLDDVEEEE